MRQFDNVPIVGNLLEEQTYSIFQNAAQLRPDRNNIRADMLAGLSVTMITVPNSIAVAVLAGINRAHGGRLMLVGVGERVHTQLTRTGVAAQICPDNIFSAQPELGAAFDKAMTSAQTWLEQVKDE